MAQYPLSNASHLEIPIKSWQRKPGGSSSRSSSFSHPQPSVTGALADENVMASPQSLTVPIHDVQASSSSSSVRHQTSTPAARKSSYYQRMSGVDANNGSGLSFMSDDEREKQSFRPAVREQDTDGSSGKDRSFSHKKIDRAECVYHCVMGYWDVTLC